MGKDKKLSFIRALLLVSLPDNPLFRPGMAQAYGSFVDFPRAILLPYLSLDPCRWM